MFKTFRDLAKYVGRHRRAFAIGSVLILANGYLSTLIPLIPGRVIDGMSTGGSALNWTQDVGQPLPPLRLAGRADGRQFH